MIPEAEAIVTVLLYVAVSIPLFGVVIAGLVIYITHR